MAAALTPQPPPQLRSTAFREQVAAELRALLARRRISQRQLARMLNSTPAWINRRLNGTTAVNTDDLQLIADALGIDPVQLFLGIRHDSDTGVITRRSHSASALPGARFPQLSAVRPGYRRVAHDYRPRRTA